MFSTPANSILKIGSIHAQTGNAPNDDAGKEVEVYNLLIIDQHTFEGKEKNLFPVLCDFQFLFMLLLFLFLFIYYCFKYHRLSIFILQISIVFLNIRSLYLTPKYSNCL